MGTARAYKEPFGGRFRLRDAGCHEDWRDYGLAAAVNQTEAAGLPVSSHLFPELSAQLLAISPQAHWLEYQDWAAPILERPLELKDGFALPQKEAGGGLAWDKDAFERYRVC